MKGILILAHGSRAKETEATLEAVVAMVHKQLPNQPVQLAYMEFGSPSLPQGLSLLVEKGCDEIAIAPYFLFDGIHIREDIPGEIKAFSQSHPNIQISLGKTLGADPRLAEILVDRIRESV